MKKIVSILLSCLLLIGTLTISSFAEEAKTITVYVDGTQVIFDAEPRMINNRTMVPMRAIFEAIGATVSWDEDTRTATSEFEETTISIQIGADNLLKNGEAIPLDVPAQVKDSRTLVPVRAIAESFDCRVEWDGENRIVRIVTTDLDSIVTESDTEVYATCGNITLYRSDYEAWIFGNDGLSEEELEEYLRYLAAMYSFAEQYDITLTVYDCDQIDRTIVDYGLQEKDGNSGTTVQALRRSLRDYSLTQKVSYALLERYISDTDAMIAHIRENGIRAKHILVETSEEAQTVLEKLNVGASFEELASEYSLDAMDVETGYVFGKGDMVEPFENAAFALAVGETSDIVQSDYGYHIIRRYALDELSDDNILYATSEQLVYAYLNDRLDAETESLSASFTVEYAK